MNKEIEQLKENFITEWGVEYDLYEQDKMVTALNAFEQSIREDMYNKVMDIMRMHNSFCGEERAREIKCAGCIEMWNSLKAIRGKK